MKRLKRIKNKFNKKSKPQISLIIILKKMKRIINAIVSLLLVILIAACSSNEPNSKEFRYLGFEKNVLLPALNERDIIFYALDFDSDKNNWELNLNDGINDIPVKLTLVEETPYGWVTVSGNLQKVYFKAPAFGTGNYTLTIKNKVTGQVLSDTFLVRDSNFDNIKSASDASFELAETENLLYYQNTTNTILSDINTTSIEKIVLENETTFSTILLEHEVNNEGKINFTIPQTTPLATYYLAVYYNSGVNKYFDKKLIVLEAQEPVIENVNKTTINSGETLILKGSNFRYAINEDFIPTKGLGYIANETKLIFNDGNNEYQLHMGRYKDDEMYTSINESFTELTFKIPAKDDFYIFSDNDRTYFEGEVYLTNGPYKTAPFTLRIDY